MDPVASAAAESERAADSATVAAATAADGVPTEDQPYTLKEIENGEADDDTTVFHFTAGVSLVKRPDDGKEVEAALLAYGWVASNYDPDAWWFEPWYGLCSGRGCVCCPLSLCRAV
jgi:hypothetical protein